MPMPRRVHRRTCILIPPERKNPGPLEPWPKPYTLATLPRKIRKRIIRIMDHDITRACLGVTCKAFYPIYLATCDLTPLKTLSQFNWTPDVGELYLLLKNWMGPDFRFARWVNKYIPNERYARGEAAALQERYRREEEDGEWRFLHLARSREPEYEPMAELERGPQTTVYIRFQLLRLHNNTPVDEEESQSLHSVEHRGGRMQRIRRGVRAATNAVNGRLQRLGKMMRRIRTGRNRGHH